MKMRSQALPTLLFTLLCIGPVVLGQTQGSVVGHVTVRAVPLEGVSISLTSPSLIQARAVRTDQNGHYAVAALPPGDYLVEMSHPGMITWRELIRVATAATTRLDVEMTLGPVEESVTVLSSKPASIDGIAIHSVVDWTRINELPIGRDIESAVVLAPGVHVLPDSGRLMISGSWTSDSIYLLDGTVINANLSGTASPLFIEDALQEATIITGALPADFGFFTGGVVNVITQSGGSTASGSARLSLDSEGWRETYPGEPDEPDTSVSQVHEATAGGTLLPDRAWFFGGARYVGEERVTPFPAQFDRYLVGTDRETRGEIKLTTQVGRDHSINGTAFLAELEQDDYAHGSPAESSVSVDRSVRNQMANLNTASLYRTDFLLETNWGERESSFLGAGGPPGSFVESTSIYLVRWDAWAGAPVFGTQGGKNRRHSRNLKVKGSWYRPTSRAGSHALSLGFDQYVHGMVENNHQSGSDFVLWTFGLPRYEGSNLLVPLARGGGFIVYFPVLEESTGSAFRTRSLFISDRIEWSPRLNTTVGLRYDRNRGHDQSGAEIADDSSVNPRVGFELDAFADGRVRLRGGYAEYATRIADGPVGNAGSPAGAPSFLYWIYAGQSIPPSDSSELLNRVWQWFESVGGVSHRGDFFLGGGTAGIEEKITGRLSSPRLREWSAGMGIRLGQRGFMRLDLIDREWSDFYARELTLENPVVFDPLRDELVQTTWITNSDAFERTYQALLLQSEYRLSSNARVGISYTASRLRGNYAGERFVPPGNKFQPEILGFEQFNPAGTLEGDVPHDLKIWFSSDFQFHPFWLNLSLLHRYHSGAAYSAVGRILIEPEHPVTPCSQCRPNPGYLDPPSTATYYFGGRGAHRLSGVSQTDLGVNVSVGRPWGEVFLEADLLNLFNETVLIRTAPGASVLTAANASCACKTFDPFTETPVEGVHYVKGTFFGDSPNPYDRQEPRSWRFSLGLRF